MNSKPNFTGYLDGRNSFSESAKTNIFGAFAGLSWKGRLDLGLGYYQTYSEPLIINLIKAGTPAQDTIYRKIYFHYFAVRASYMFYKSKKWEVSIPASVGVGPGEMTEYIKTTPDRKLELKKQSSIYVFPFETGADVTYLITPWFTFSAGMGYRLNMGHFNYNRQFSAYYYRYGLGIRFGYIYRKFKQSKLGKFTSKCCCLF